MTALDHRVRLTKATKDRFAGKPFRWGSCDCVRIAAWHVRQFGHRPALAKAGSYKSAASARAALKRAGFDALAEALDALGFPRIAPAAALVGDLVMGDSGDAFGALGIYLGNGAMLGFHEDVPHAAVLRRVHLGTAWRVLPV
jgi:hypothetical protein